MNAKHTITISGICANNEHMINRILAEIGCSNLHEYVNEVTAVARFNRKHTTQDEIAVTIGRFIMNGFTISIK